MILLPVIWFAFWIVVALAAGAALMSAQPDNGGPAAPCMTLRDWLAGQETLSDYDHPDSWKHYGVILEAVSGRPPDAAAEPLSYFKWECEARAKIRFMRADAMIAARKGGSHD